MIKFQRRHYKFLADILKETKACPKIVEVFADHLKGTNPNFKRERFIEASTQKEG